MRKKPTLPKDRRTLRQKLDHLEKMETIDWVNDKKKREYKKSAKYLEGSELAEKFKKKAQE